jgi:lipoprotein-releasing system permease protein
VETTVKKPAVMLVDNPYFRRMKTTGFIARRYLFSKKHVSLISTLTIISVTGVTIGTALLIVVLSVFNGFFDVIKGLLLNNDPDIRIESAEGQPFVYSQDLRNELGVKQSSNGGAMDTPGFQEIPEITVISPYIEGKALLTAGQDRDQVVNIRGIDPESYNRLNGLENNLTEGELNLGVENKRPGLIMSSRLLTQMNLNLGQEVALLSAKGMRKSLTQFSVPRTFRFEIRGIYSFTQIIDNPAVYIDIRAAQRLFEYRNTISGIDLRLQDNEQADAVKEKLESRFEKGKYKISTWYDLQKPLYDVMYLEKWGAYIVLMIIVLVAVLNIVGSLTMIVIQKNRDIGVLLTVGYTPAHIKQIFVKQGLYIGLIGCVLGGGIGLFFSWLQQQYGLIKLSNAFIINAYPVSIESLDVAIILAGSLLLCLLASWYPANRAATIEPADAVRFE